MISDHPTADSAIAAALAQDWKEAIHVNLAILKSDKSDLEALCRLAFAYLKTGQLLTAKRTYQKVLDLDKYNQIASKNLKKMTSLKKKDMANEGATFMSPMIFLEEPGKTKIVECRRGALPYSLDAFGGPGSIPETETTRHRSTDEQQHLYRRASG
jgi:tetratricopeptide (TPR) repeat protein